jgi:predicted transcriptional regulator
MVAKKEKDVTITFTVPQELHKRLHRQAAKSQRSLAGTCRWALMAYLNSEEAEKDANGST